MDYVRRLLQETDYLEQLKKLEELETERRFCRHGLTHLLDVARIAWIQVLEQQLPISKEDIYLAALLHDLGRILEYQEGIPHQEAGRKLAERLLRQISYPEKSTGVILDVIGAHRSNNKLNDDFINIIRRADHSSRNCFCCEAEADCKWSREQRNRTITN